MDRWREENTALNSVGMRRNTAVPLHHLTVMAAHQNNFTVSGGSLIFEILRLRCSHGQLCSSFHCIMLT
jgi:hypothetical protein